MDPLTIDVSKISLTDDQFYHLCRQNEVLRFEINAQGEMIVMGPVGGDSGRREMSIGARLWVWNDGAGLGEVFSSSTIFRFPNGAKRSPDAAWVARDRWEALSEDDRSKFPPLAPDFVVELRSRTDELDPLRTKMQEYLSNGVRLGWLINPQDQQAEIYRLDSFNLIQIETIDLPTELSGESVLPGFSLTVPKF
jgi:Uma2 family endonuclease